MLDEVYLNGVVKLVYLCKLSDYGDVHVNVIWKMNMILILAIDEFEHLWPCFECNERFVSSEELQKHLNVHDNERVSWTPFCMNSDVKICTTFIKSAIHSYDVYCTSIIIMYEFISYRRKKEIV